MAQDEIIRDLLQSYEELEELYRVATLQQKVSEALTVVMAADSVAGDQPLKLSPL